MASAHIGAVAILLVALRSLPTLVSARFQSADSAHVWVGKYTSFHRGAAGIANATNSTDETMLWAIGRNNYRQLGIADSGSPPCWAPVVFPQSSARLVQVAAGAWHTLFMFDDGAVYGG